MIYTKTEAKMNVAKAKVFMNGRSQAIRLPKEFRVEGDEVYITKEKNQIVIIEKNKQEDIKTVLDNLFGCCPDFDVSRDKIISNPREVNL
jgi:antitoxin VapB